MVDIQDFNPDERIVAAAAEQRQHERRVMHVCLVLFGLVTAVLIYVWLQWTIGERTCKRWMDRGEPRLESITIELTSKWDPGEVTCEDEEAIRYFEATLAAAAPSAFDPNSYYFDCNVVLRFANGAEYRSPGPCEISAKGIQLPLPLEKTHSGSYSFRDRMPDGWKQALNTLLGPESVK